MAHLGTNANNSLTAWTFSQSPSVLTPTNMAALKLGIVDDLNPLTISGAGKFQGSQSPWPMIDYNGLLMIPRRGQVKVYPGDVIAFDTQSGWPIIVSAQAIAVGSSSWTYS